MWLIIVILLIPLTILIIRKSLKKEEDQYISTMPENERQQYLYEKEQNERELIYGKVNPELICPHCQVKGKVRVTTAISSEKNGISGAKATAAILTGGASLLVTGLSKKETKISTRAFCENCKLTWYI